MVARDESTDGDQAKYADPSEPEDPEAGDGEEEVEPTDVAAEVGDDELEEVATVVTVVAAQRTGVPREDAQVETRRAVRDMDEARRTLLALLTEVPMREAWRQLHRELDAGAIEPRALWHTPPYEGDEVSRPVEDVGAIVLLLRRSQGAIDPVFGEPVPDAFVRRRLLRLVERLEPDSQTVGLLRARLPVTADAGLLGRLSRATAALREAEGTMVRLHFGLVNWIVRRFEARGLEHDDLLQEAAAGLLRGVRRFRPERGTRFATYALYWMRATLERSLANTSRLVRLPVHLQGDLALVRKAARANVSSYKAEPEAIAAATGLDIDRVRRLLIVVQFRPVSIDADESSEEALTLPDSTRPSQDDVLSALGDRAAIDEALAGLEAREREIIVRRFGLDGTEEETLEVIGERFGVTRERIRQLQNRALERLRQRLGRIEK